MTNFIQYNQEISTTLIVIVSTVCLNLIWFVKTWKFFGLIYQKLIKKNSILFAKFFFSNFLFNYILYLSKFFDWKISAKTYLKYIFQISKEIFFHIFLPLFYLVVENFCFIKTSLFNQLFVIKLDNLFSLQRYITTFSS